MYAYTAREIYIKAETEEKAKEIYEKIEVAAKRRERFIIVVRSKEYDLETMIDILRSKNFVVTPHDVDDGDYHRSGKTYSYKVSF